MMNILSYSLIALAWDSASGNSVNYVLVAFLILVLMNYMWLLRKTSFLQQKSDFCVNTIHKTNVELMNTKLMLEDLLSVNIPPLVFTQIKQVVGQIDDAIFSNKSAFSLYVGKNTGKPQTEEYELYTYLTSLIHRNREHAENCGVKLNVCKDAGYRGCHINETALTAALQGLVERTVDNTPPDGSVNVAVSCLDDRWNLEIFNSPLAKDYKRCFGLLFTAIKVWCCGSLRLVWQIVKSHGGRITGYELGQSVYYKVTLPVNDDKSEDDPGVEGTADIGKLPHILLIMEDKELSDYLKAALAPSYRVSVYAHYEPNAIPVSNENTDIVIIDAEAEDSKLCSRIKTNKQTSDVKVLLLTTSNDADVLKELKECRADRILPRLVPVEKLKAELLSIREESEQQLERVRRLVNTNFSAGYPEDLMLSEEDAAIMRKINEFLEEHLGERFKIKMLASELRICSTKLYMLMKRITNVSTTCYILAFRMERAKKLLLTRQHKVGEIATMVGYNNDKYFGKEFKKYCDFAPREYMKKHGKTGRLSGQKG